MAPLDISLFILLGVLWLMLFVWYGPEMGGMLFVGEGLELKLQNVFIWLYSACLIVFTHLFQADNLLLPAGSE